MQFTIHSYVEYDPVTIYMLLLRHQYSSLHRLHELDYIIRMVKLSQQITWLRMMPACTADK